MYIFKNAFRNITRNLGRNVLIGIIILVISASAAIALAIKNTATTLIESNREKNDIEATIVMNRENLMGSFKNGSSQEDKIDIFNNISSLTSEEIENYANSDYVKSYQYTYTISVNSSNIEKATQEIENDDFSKNFGGDTPKFDAKNEKMDTADFELVGYNSLDAMTEFIEGKYKITSGEVSDNFEETNCLINSELAELNDIEVGDTITLVSPNDTSIKYKFTVTGIFEENSDDDDDMFSMFTNSVNTIITNTNVVNKFVNADEDLKLQVNPTFVLNSEDVVDAFTEEVTEKGLSEYYTVSTNLEEIDSEMESIENVSTFATVFLIIILIIGGIILFVINAINVRERKYEIGVLRTIGMKKLALISEFTSELLIVAFASVLLGAATGSLLSVPTSNMLLENEINSATESANDMRENFGQKGNMDFNKTSSDKQIAKRTTSITSLNATINFKVLLELIGIGLLLTAISSISSSVSIIRFSPITILKERS